MAYFFEKCSSQELIILANYAMVIDWLFWGKYYVVYKPFYWLNAWELAMFYQLF